MYFLEYLNSFWIDIKIHNELWYSGKQIGDVNLKISRIQPPHCISRTPRSIELRSY